jgi:hypothetical protein
MGVGLHENGRLAEGVELECGSQLVEESFQGASNSPSLPPPQTLTLPPPARAGAAFHTNKWGAGRGAATLPRQGISATVRGAQIGEGERRHSPLPGPKDRSFTTEATAFECETSTRGELGGRIPDGVQRLHRWLNGSSKPLTQLQPREPWPLLEQEHNKAVRAKVRKRTGLLHSE